LMRGWSDSAAGSGREATELRKRVDTIPHSD
jgi:hypothetical protein